MRVYNILKQYGMNVTISEHGQILVESEYVLNGEHGVDVLDATEWTEEYTLSWLGY